MEWAILAATQFGALWILLARSVLPGRLWFLFLETVNSGRCRPVTSMFFSNIPNSQLCLTVVTRMHLYGKLLF